MKIIGLGSQLSQHKGLPFHSEDMSSSLPHPQQLAVVASSVVPVLSGRDSSQLMYMVKLRSQ